MVRVIKRSKVKVQDKLTGEVHFNETYFVKNLYWPDQFKIINQELNYPNSWAGNSRIILQDNKKLFEIQKGTGTEYYDMLVDSQNDNYNLMNTLLGIIGYPHMSKPSDYNTLTKKSKGFGQGGYYGYQGYNPANFKTKIPKKKVEEKKVKDDWDSNAYDSFIELGNIETNEDNYNINVKPHKVIKPIMDEIRVLGIPMYHTHIYEESYDYKSDGGEFITEMLKGRITHNIYDSAEKEKQIEQFIKTPLITTSFYKYFKTVPINWRAYNKYINRNRDGELDDCIIPGVGAHKIDFPKGPFIFMIKEYDTQQPFEENGITRIYLIFGEIDRKDYNLNIVKGKGYLNTHQFKNATKAQKRKGESFSDRIFLGLEATMQSNVLRCENFFGPILNNTSPIGLRSIRREWQDEEEEDEQDYPVRQLYFKYKTIELKDISPKIVNWPRTKPIKLN